MKRKYFFFDIDGTLGLKLTKQLPADTAYCLKRLVQKGHFIAIATGRAQYDAAHVAKAYGIHSFVADGGNSLTLDGKILKLEPLPLTAAKAVLREFEKQGIPWAAATENEPIMRSKYDSFDISGYTHFEQHYGTDDTIHSSRLQDFFRLPCSYAELTRPPRHSLFRKPSFNRTDSQRKRDFRTHENDG